MPEYALMVALIAVVCIIAVTAVGVAANGQFTAIGQAIAGA
jgi:Flp pilus assembly pilin Flp